MADEALGPPRGCSRRPPQPSAPLARPGRRAARGVAQRSVPVVPREGTRRQGPAGVGAPVCSASPGSRFFSGWLL